MQIHDLGTHRDAELHNASRILALVLDTVRVVLLPDTEEMTARTLVDFVFGALSEDVAFNRCLVDGGGGSLDCAIVRARISSLNHADRHKQSGLRTHKR
jgi:hypothetical protein